MPFDSVPHSRTFAGVLAWQMRLRVIVASVYALGSMILQAAGMFTGSTMSMAVTLLSYVALTVSMRQIAQHARRTVMLPVVITIVSDLAFVFAATALTSSPAYYNRILILSFFVVHICETYFGRLHAMLALVVASLGYVGLVASAINGGAALSFGESLWSVLAFWATGSALVLHHGEIQRRLNRIVGLFERAEEGDFTQTYDARSDRFPDVVTRVGRAYNRVQVQLAEMVLNDPLTGCFNRRGFDQALTREMTRASRTGTQLSLIAVDLDHFKAVNDTLGHLGGDSVLREFGALLCHAARGGDMVARTGGEEFSVLLPETDEEGAVQVADRLCERIRRQVFMVSGKPLELTASFGVISTSRIRGVSDVDLKQHADEALYAAKDAGRNCVRVWTPELQTRVHDSLERRAVRASVAG